MTDDIDTLSGPELSAAVAREVMGWRLDSVGNLWVPPNRLAWEGLSCFDWQPHTDRNDSHRVLMRCKELGIVPDLNTWIVKASEVTMFTLLTIDSTIICRAALRAVRESK